MMEYKDKSISTEMAYLITPDLTTLRPGNNNVKRQV